MNNQTDTQDTLPEPAITSYQTDSVMRVRELHTFNADQMRAYVDADRTLRAGTSPSLSDKEIDAIAVATFATIHKSAIVSASRWDLLFARAIEAKCRTLRAGQSEPVATALERFTAIESECDDDELRHEAPIERLRFFCSLSMRGQDWLDVEPFFDALAPKSSEADGKGIAP